MSRPDFQQAQEAQLRARAARMAHAAIGKTMTVRTQDSGPKEYRATVTGKIVEAAFDRFRYTGCSVQVVWKIVVKSDRAGTRHTFHVHSLPR